MLYIVRFLKDIKNRQREPTRIANQAGPKAGGTAHSGTHNVMPGAECVPVHLIQAAINELQSTNSGGNATNSDFRGTLEAVPRKVSKSKGKDGQTDDGIRLVEPGEAVEVSSPSDWGSCGAARACQAQHEVDAV